ncbi:hypothetical protein ABT104_28035 [Streptomyces mobaraensis]|uniref:hypothetical protein n=1 Tax=Streptomyces mobaraensis TaxID=35621 RepID=UPI00331E0579
MRSGGRVLVVDAVVPPGNEPQPAEPVPGAPYVIHLAYHGEAGLVVHEDKLWVNAAPRPEWARFTFERVIGGVKILSDKGLDLHAGHRGAQVELTSPQPEFQATWTLEFVRPLGEECPRQLSAEQTVYGGCPLGSFR